MQSDDVNEGPAKALRSTPRGHFPSCCCHHHRPHCINGKKGSPVRTRSLHGVIQPASGRNRLIPGSDLEVWVFNYYPKDGSASRAREEWREDRFQERPGRRGDRQLGSEKMTSLRLSDHSIYRAWFSGWEMRRTQTRTIHKGPNGLSFMDLHGGGVGTSPRRWEGNS